MKKLSMQGKRNIEAFVFLLPWLIGCVCFFLYPAAVSLRLSLSQITSMRGFVMEYIGFNNYLRAFVWDVNFVPMFISVIRDTLINTPITLVFSLIIAIIISRDIKMRGFFRTSFFLPVLLGTGFVMRQLLNMGVADQAMAVATSIGLPDSVMQAVDPSITMAIYEFLSRITVILWKSGVQILLFLAGLQGISISLYEAARCDGSTEWEAFWKITLPLISPVLLLNFMYTVIDSFTDSSNRIVDYVINQSFKNQEYAYGAAMGWIYFIFIFVLSVIILLFMQKRVYDTSER